MRLGYIELQDSEPEADGLLEVVSRIDGLVRKLVFRSFVRSFVYSLRGGVSSELL